MPCNTTDIYPTLLEIAGVTIEDQPVLDGISLVPLFNEKMETRNKPMGFWQYTTRGQIVPSHAIMQELLEAQKAGNMEVDPSLLKTDAGKITMQYPENILTGHAAWLNWPYKLHRIQDKPEEIIFELYNLEEDPLEENDLASKDASRVNTMKTGLENWQVSVIRSLNGEDY